MGTLRYRDENVAYPLIKPTKNPNPPMFNNAFNYIEYSLSVDQTNNSLLNTVLYTKNTLMEQTNIFLCVTKLYHETGFKLYKVNRKSNVSWHIYLSGCEINHVVWNELFFSDIFCLERKKEKKVKLIMLQLIILQLIILQIVVVQLEPW